MSESIDPREQDEGPPPAGRAWAAIAIGVSTFVIGIFASLTLGWPAFIAFYALSIMGIWFGSTSLRKAPRGHRVWLLAIVGLIMCSFDLVLLTLMFILSIAAQNAKA